MSIGNMTFIDCLNLNTVTIESEIIAQEGVGDSILLDYATTLYIKNTISDISTNIYDVFKELPFTNKAGYVQFALI